MFYVFYVVNNGIKLKLFGQNIHQQYSRNAILQVDPLSEEYLHCNTKSASFGKNVIALCEI
jgi:hypothetical protein